jgi:hypothetical protein
MSSKQQPAPKRSRVPPALEDLPRGPQELSTEESDAVRGGFFFGVHVNPKSLPPSWKEEGTTLTGGFSPSEMESWEERA